MNSQCAQAQRHFLRINVKQKTKHLHTSLLPETVQSTFQIQEKEQDS